jgi:hypothetical protein
MHVYQFDDRSITVQTVEESCRPSRFLMLPCRPLSCSKRFARAATLSVRLR